MQGSDNWEYLCCCGSVFKEGHEKKSREKIASHVLLRHENGPVRKSRKTVAAIKEWAKSN
jgi:hypothetical protein